MLTDKPDVLIYGYGNPGRCDDGLGVAFSERMGELFPGEITTDSNFQLNAEDALDISEKDIVIFADASVNDINGFSVSLLEPDKEIGFTTHAMSPGSVLALCMEIYGKKPDTYLLEIKGEEWGLGDSLSDKGRSNLESAVEWFSPLIGNRERSGIFKAVSELG